MIVKERIREVLRKNILLTLSCFRNVFSVWGLANTLDIRVIRCFAETFHYFTENQKDESCKYFSLGNQIKNIFNVLDLSLLVRYDLCIFLIELYFNIFICKNKDFFFHFSKYVKRQVSTSWNLSYINESIYTKNVLLKFAIKKQIKNVHHIQRWMFLTVIVPVLNLKIYLIM